MYVSLFKNYISRLELIGFYLHGLPIVIKKLLFWDENLLSQLFFIFVSKYILMKDNEEEPVISSVSLLVYNNNVYNHKTPYIGQCTHLTFS